MQSSLVDANLTQTLSRFNFPVLDRTLSFRQVGSVESNLGTGSVIWDAGKVLAKYLERQRILSKPTSQFMRLIELGSGCGVSGISAIQLLKGSASLGKNPAFEFILTDIEKMLPLLQQNLCNNAPQFTHLINPEENDPTCANLHVVPLQWEYGLGELENKVGDGFDYILGSDVVFKESMVIPLLSCIFQLANTRTTILIAMEIRDVVLLETFQEKMSSCFTFRKIPMKKMHSEYKSEFIAIFTLRKKKDSDLSMLTPITH